MLRPLGHAVESALDMYYPDAMRPALEVIGASPGAGT